MKCFSEHLIKIKNENPYKKFLEAYKAAYPDLETQIQLEYN